MRIHIVVISTVVACFASPAIAATPGRPAQRAELRHERALWSVQHLHDYRFRLRVDCFCADRGKPAIITVRNGRPHGATGFLKQFDTVPELFDHIGHALNSSRSGAVVVRYDAKRGFPRSASIDNIKAAIDDENGWTVDRFRVL